MDEALLVVGELRLRGERHRDITVDCPSVMLPRDFERVRFALEIQVQPQRVLELRHERIRDLTHASSDPLDRDGADLLGLRLRVASQSALRGREEHLKRIDPAHVEGYRDHGDDAAVESGCRRIGTVIADDHRGTTLARFRAPHGLEVHLPDLTSKH